MSISVSGSVRMLQVRDCLMHYTHRSPHKDRSTMVCTCECAELWSARVHGGSSRPVFAGAIPRRCKVRVRVSSTQLSPSELFLKIPLDSFSCYLNIINLAQPGKLKAYRGFHSIFIWQDGEGKKAFYLWLGQTFNVLTVLGVKTETESKCVGSGFYKTEGQTSVEVRPVRLLVKVTLDHTFSNCIILLPNADWIKVNQQTFSR